MVQIRGDAVPSGSGGPQRKPMSEGELKGILNAKVTNSLGYYGGKLSKARVTALQYYNGEPFGNELDGRSQVVSRDLQEAIDSMMPSLMKIFTSGEQIVRFEPSAKDVPDGTPIQQVMAQLKLSEEKAKQATDYCNWIWTQQNEGFQIFHDWFKDALLNRVGAIKIWWDEQEDITKETYKGLTDAEFTFLMQDAETDALELVEHTEYPDPAKLAAVPSVTATQAPPAVSGAPPLPASPPGQTSSVATPQSSPQASGGAPIGGGAPLFPLAPPPMLHDVVLRRTNKTGRVRIIPIPGEEFLMDRRATSLEKDNPFCAHRAKKTISDLLEMGYKWDVIKTLGEGDSSDFNLERLERFRQEDELPYRTGNNYDPAMKEVWINECYMNVDWDGDGIAELRKIIFAGESGNFAPGATVILENEETDDNPFAAVTPIPMPHKFYGMSTADQVMDLQLIKSTLWRNTLDHTYNAIMPQVVINDSQVNLDDLLTRRPGGVIRTKGNPQESVFPMPNGEMGVDPFQMIEYVDKVRELRTGVQRFVAGPNADSLNNAYTETATGANIVENSSQERIELIARCFAEIGVKPAFRKILKLVTTHQNRPKIIQLRGKFVPMDPREWDDSFDMTVTVGLGTGNRTQKLQGMTTLLQVDQQIINLQKGVNGPILTAENVYHKLAKICEYLGLKNAEPYYTDPSQAPQQPQQPAPPDPHVQAAQIKAQADQQATQLQIQADAQKAQFQAQLDAKKMQLQMQAEAQKIQLELAMRERVELAKVQAQREIEYARIAADREEFNAEAQLKLHQHATDTALKREDLYMRKRSQENGAELSK